MNRIIKLLPFINQLQRKSLTQLPISQYSDRGAKKSSFFGEKDEKTKKSNFFKNNRKDQPNLTKSEKVIQRRDFHEPKISPFQKAQPKKQLKDKLDSILSEQDLNTIKDHLKLDSIDLDQLITNSELENGYKRNKNQQQIAKMVLHRVLQMEIPVTKPLCAYFLSTLLVHNYDRFQFFDQQFQYGMMNLMFKNKDFVFDYISQDQSEKSKLKMLISLKIIMNRKMDKQMGKILWDISAKLYNRVKQIFQKIDFSNLAKKEELLQLFIRLIKTKSTIRQQIKIIKIIVDQIPFFPAPQIIPFLINYEEITFRADYDALCRIFDLVMIDRQGSFQQVDVEQYFQIMPALKNLSHRTTNEQLLARIAGVNLILFQNVFSKIDKDGSVRYSKDFVFNFLIEISEQVEIIPQVEASQNLFYYLKHLIVKSKDQDYQTNLHNLNSLFQLLATLINNQFIKWHHFQSEFTFVISALDILIKKYPKLKQSYLYKMMKEGKEYDRLLEYLRCSWFLDVNLQKFISLAEKINLAEDRQLCKRLVFQLVKKVKNTYILKLKSSLPEHEYHYLMNIINEKLVKFQDLSIYRQIFVKIISKREEFIDIVIEIIDTVHRTQDADPAQICGYLLDACLQVIYCQIIPFKKIMHSLMFIFEHYINKLEMASMLLQIPAFYYLLLRMIRQIKNIKLQQNISELQVNVYKLLHFIFDPSNQHLVIDSIIENSIRYVTLDDLIIDKLKNVVQTKQLQKSLLLYKLNHVIMQQQVKLIYEEIVVNHKLDISQPQRLLIAKKFNPELVIEMKIERDYLFLLFLEKNHSKFDQYRDQITKIIKDLNEFQLELCLSNFYCSVQTINGYYFPLIWSCFIKKIKNPHKIIWQHLIPKYAHQKKMPPFMINKLIIIFIEFYAANPSFLDYRAHSRLFHYIKLLKINHFHPQKVDKYITAFKTYLFSSLNYLNNAQKYPLLEPMLQFGKVLDYEEFISVKDEIFNSENGFAIIIMHEDHFSESNFRDILEQYLILRKNKLNINLMQESTFIQHYISRQYPELTEKLKKIKEKDFSSSLSRQIGRQFKYQSYIKKLFSRYQQLDRSPKYWFVCNEKYLIYFCDKQWQPNQRFMSKFYSLLPESSHRELISLDINDDFNKIFNDLERKKILKQSAKKAQGIKESEDEHHS